MDCFVIVLSVREYLLATIESLLFKQDLRDGFSSPFRLRGFQSTALLQAVSLLWI